MTQDISDQPEQLRMLLATLWQSRRQWQMIAHAAVTHAEWMSAHTAEIRTELDATRLALRRMRAGQEMEVATLRDRLQRDAARIAGLSARVVELEARQ